MDAALESRAAALEALRQYSAQGSALLLEKQRHYLRAGLGSPAYQKKFDDLRDGLASNAIFLNAVSQNEEHDMRDSLLHESRCPPRTPHKRPQRNDVPVQEKQRQVRSALQLVVRDWSDAGRDERQPVYGEILRRLNEHSSSRPRSHFSVLVPGAGLSRLAFDVAAAGYKCEGNEKSYIHLALSQFMLNVEKEAFEICPWVLDFRNMATLRGQLQSARVPDVRVADLMPLDGEFSIVAGAFEEVYVSKSAAFHAVASSWFLDTLPNVKEVVRIIYEILKPNGLWINVGPLQWHTPASSSMSLELTYEELRQVITDAGFQLRAETTTEALYCANPKSGLKYRYTCFVFSAVKAGTSNP